MTEATDIDSYDPEMEKILSGLLDRDEDITARAVIRLHSTLSAASSITRNPSRIKMMEKYKARQDEFRVWRRRLSKKSRQSSEMDFLEKDARISELERQVDFLTVSHVAMLRAVGELGGFSKWSKFFDSYKEVRNDLINMGAIPDAQIFEITSSNNTTEATSSKRHRSNPKKPPSKFP